MKLSDILNLADNDIPFFIKYGLFIKEQNRHAFVGEWFATKSEIPEKLYGRTVTRIGIYKENTSNKTSILVEL